MVTIDSPTTRRLSDRVSSELGSSSVVVCGFLVDTLVAEFQPMVACICASYERDVELARELAQEAWLAIWRALPNYRGDATLKTLVARIAQFRAVSHVARRSHPPRHRPV